MPESCRNREGWKWVKFPSTGPETDTQHSYGSGCFLFPFPVLISELLKMLGPAISNAVNAYLEKGRKQKKTRQ